MYRRIGCCDEDGSVLNVLEEKPDAVCCISGDGEFSELFAFVKFFQTETGVVIWAEAKGLPGICRIFAFHIHEGTDCSGNMNDHFSDAMGHYNPYNCEHPYHAGDLPPLFGNNGNALSIFLTNRFCVEEIIGRTMIIHNGPDDFTTQPAGNSGIKIGCGIIMAE